MANTFEVSMTTSTSGAEVCIYQLSNKAKPKGVVQISHGLAEHGGRYERFAIALLNAGYHVIAQDHRGHGKTTAPDAPLGVFSGEGGLQKVMQDMAHVNSIAHDMAGGAPVILFGHSMGMILGFNYLLRHPNTVSAAALWNSGFDTGVELAVYKLLLKTERMFKGSDVASAVAHRMTFVDWNKKFAPNRTSSDWLSRDEAEVDKFESDPLCGIPVSVGLWFDLFDAVEFGADDSNLDELPKSLPMHLIAGGVDPCTKKGKTTQNLYERLKKQNLTDLQFQILKDTRHESLNEINRDEITTEFIDWLDKRFSK